MAIRAQCGITPDAFRLSSHFYSILRHFVEGRELAEAAAGVGFDGIDIAVRKGGHIEPAVVARDLPALVAIIRRQGLEVPMITTEIADTETPFAEDILRAAAGADRQQPSQCRGEKDRVDEDLDRRWMAKKRR